MSKDQINIQRQKICSMLDLDKKIEFFKNIKKEEQGFVLLRCPKKNQKELLNYLNEQEIFEFIKYLDPDETTDLLQIINPDKKYNLIKKLNEDIKEKVNYLLKFDPASAAGIMNLDYIEIDKNITFKALSQMIIKHEKRTGKFPTILVLKEGILLGELKGHSLSLHDKNKKIYNYVKPIGLIKYNETTEEVVKKFKSNQHNKVVVLDEDDSVMGVIYSDDILRILHEKQEKSLYEFAGVNPEEGVYDNISSKVKYRYKWLIINIIHSFLAVFVISHFETTISSLVILAAYMPIVAGMGGNAATQTLAVVIRGIALKEIDLKSSKKFIIREMTAGAINGLITGIIIGFIALIFNQNILLGLILTIAMISNLFLAGIFGTIIPLTLKKLGKDPATSATVFITTLTDVFGFFIFLMLATIIIL
jgi:magnesium transporter